MLMIFARMQEVFHAPGLRLGAQDVGHCTGLWGMAKSEADGGLAGSGQEGIPWITPLSTMGSLWGVHREWRCPKFIPQVYIQVLQVVMEILYKVETNFDHMHVYDPSYAYFTYVN